MDPYQPWVAASSLSPCRIWAYAGCRSSRLGGCTLIPPSRWWSLKPFDMSADLPFPVSIVLLVLVLVDGRLMLRVEEDSMATTQIAMRRVSRTVEATEKKGVYKSFIYAFVKA